MSRRSTPEGMTVRAFALHIGKSVQWARKLKREDSPEWQAYLARQASGADPAPPAETPAPASMHSPMDDLRRALEAKDRAWVIFDKAAKAAENGSKVLVEQVALNRAAKEARDAYEKACKHAAQAQQEAQQWVSVDRVASIRAALRQLEDVVQNWETTLAGLLPDDVRPKFHEAFTAAKPAWNQGVKTVNDYINTLLPVPC